MTDDLDARLAALQGRRRHAPINEGAPRAIGDPITGQRVADPRVAPDAPRQSSSTPKPRRQGHAAPAGRILAVGMSVSATVALTAAMTQSAASPNPEATSGSTNQAAAPTPLAVHVVLPDGRTVQATQRLGGSAQPAPQTTTRPAPVTRTRAS